MSALAPEDRPDPVLAALRGRVDEVRGRIEAALARSGRPSGSVRLVAVVKNVSAAVAARLPEAGVFDLGENRVQEAEAKRPSLPAGLTHHLVGHLQGNKARRALALFDLIHSVDSPALARRLDHTAEEMARPVVNALVQVNVSGEDQKHGLPPEEVRGFLAVAAGLPRLRILGLMGMAAAGAPEEARPAFRALARIREDANRSAWYRDPLSETSAGMTNDYEIAIEEGATIVRVGTALFAETPAGADLARREEQ